MAKRRGEPLKPRKILLEIIASRTTAFMPANNCHLLRTPRPKDLVKAVQFSELAIATCGASAPTRATLLMPPALRG